MIPALIRFVYTDDSYVELTILFPGPGLFKAGEAANYWCQGVRATADVTPLVMTMGVTGPEKYQSHDYEGIKKYLYQYWPEEETGR